MTEAVNHPAHYGGEDNPYEVVKVAEAWGFDKDAYLFNVLKYIGRPAKGNYLEDLKKARWYLERKIKRLEQYAFPPEPEVLPNAVTRATASKEGRWVTIHHLPDGEEGFARRSTNVFTMFSTETRVAAECAQNNMRLEGEYKLRLFNSAGNSVSLAGDYPLGLTYDALDLGDELRLVEA